MDCYTLELDSETGKYITLYLYTDVENTAELRKRIISGELKCCVLKASLIVDPFQVVVAANKAVVNEKFGKLTTKSVFTEILFNLSLSKNITQSLTKFGIDDSEKNILVAVIHEAEDGGILARDALSVVRGKRVPIEKLKDLTNVSLVKKTYKIDDSELKVSSVVDSVVSRMSTKDFASY